MLPSAWLLCTCPVFSFAQSLPATYESVPVNDKRFYAAFPQNWSLCEQVTMHPEKESGLLVQPGNRLLLGKAGQPLVTTIRGKNLRVYMEYQLASRASALLSLPGGVKILLSDQRDIQPSSLTSGYVLQPPLQNAGKYPGLWQTLEADYESEIPLRPGVARLNRLLLNGVPVQESVYTPAGPQADAQAVSLEVVHGTLAVRTLGYEVMETGRPVRIADLTYKIYADAWDSRLTNRLEQTGKSAELTQEVTSGKKEFNLVYEGDLFADEDADYTFTTIYSGAYCQFVIDGFPVNDTGASSSQERHSRSVRLSKGPHRFRLWYSRFPWSQPALGLLIEKRGIRPYALHAPGSLPEPPPKPFIVVRPAAAKPEMVRSFVRYGDEPYKRTHCLSVGNPAGMHYTVDLNRGALLQVWKGEFANTTEMWYERGEPQVLAPLGLTVAVSGKSSFARLENPQSAWPDSSHIRYLDYRIDAAGTPTVRYALGTAVVSDMLTASPQGLVRTLRAEGVPAGNLFVLAGAGNQITPVENGLYLVDNRYYLRIPARHKPVLRTSGGKKELLLPLSASLTYTMFW